MNRWPLLGSPDAPHVILVLFDYTCPSCRRFFRILTEVRKKYGDKLAIIMVPLPQDVGCNSLIKTQSEPTGYACAYARLALGVWASNPRKYADFQEWVFARPAAPPLADAVEKARNMFRVSEDPSLPNPLFDQMLREALWLHNTVACDTVPTVIMAKGWMRGEPTSPQGLVALLNYEFEREAHSVRRNKR